MPRLVCWNCGRQVHATSPLSSLFGGESRCPRCGVLLSFERRGVERCGPVRRQGSPGDPGRPADAGERRLADRRLGPRRSCP